MATDAYIGDAFIFQVAYLDNTGVPVPVTNTTISIFYFEPVMGVKIMLVDGAVMVPASPPDPGRFVYLYTIPSALADGTILYAEYRATDPLTLFVTVTPETLNLHPHPSDAGLRFRFVR